MIRLTGFHGWWISLFFGAIITGLTALFLRLLKRPLNGIYLVLLPLLLVLGVLTIYFFAFLSSYVLFFALAFLILFLVYFLLRRKFAFQKYFLGLAWGGMLFFFYIWLGMGFQIYKDFRASIEGMVFSEIQEAGLERVVVTDAQRWVNPADWGIAPYRWYHYFTDRLNVVMQISPLKPQYAIHFPGRPRGGWVGISEKTPQQLILGHAEYLKLQENFVWAKLIDVRGVPAEEFPAGAEGVKVIEYELFDLTQNQAVFIYMIYLPRGIPGDDSRKRTWVFSISLESEVRVDYYIDRILDGFLPPAAE